MNSELHTPSESLACGVDVRKNMALSDIAEVIMGQSPAGDACNGSGEGVPLLNGPTEFGGRHPQPVQYTVDVRKQAIKGDLLFCVRGSTTGRMNWADQTYAIGRGLAAIRGKNGYPNSFVRAVIEYKLEYLLAQATGSTFPNVGRDQLNGLEFPSVEKSTANQISSILDPIDDRIALLRETNTTLESIAQALFKSWFVDFDPVHANAGTQAPSLPPEIQNLFPSTFVESPLGLVPEGWGVNQIQDVVYGVYDGPHATPPESDSGPTFLGIKNLTGTSLDLSDIRHIAESDYERWTKRIIPQCGDIVFSYEATLGFFSLIPEDLKCCLGRRLALIRPKLENGFGHFWFHQFISTPFQNMLVKHTIQGATVNRIALKAFPSYLVLDPPDEIKSIFESSAAILWKKIQSNYSAVLTLSDIRDTLLPRLISGQLRLPEVEELLQ